MVYGRFRSDAGAAPDRQEGGSPHTLSGWQLTVCCAGGRAQLKTTLYVALKPAIAQLVEHLTVECCSNQMVPGSIPGGRKFRIQVLKLTAYIHMCMQSVAQPKLQAHTQACTHTGAHRYIDARID